MWALRATMIEDMHLLTDTPVDATSQFVMPGIVPTTLSVNPAKYSYQVFDLQQQLLSQNYELAKITSRPMLALFGQGGYGKPGLNFLKNELEPFYVLGVRANWKFGNLYTKSNDREIMDLGMQKITARKETLALQTDVRFSNYGIEIEKIQALTTKDRDLLLLRQEITETAKIQLENGVMNSTDYLARFNEERVVKENASLREVQLLKAQYMLAHIAGNYSD
ncbi:MAG: hypothetical protein IPL46_02430 [Saprospiraceae bacterium]|nr:hypothetical protein [Saprospiraceae bacterium]